MNQIIAINKEQINGAEINSVNARDLHKYLGLKSKFADWAKKELELFEQNVDYVGFHNKMKANNATLKEYIVTLDTAKHLAMIQRNDKGREVRQYFIDYEKQANKPLTLAEQLLASAQHMVDQERNNVVTNDRLVMLEQKIKPQEHKPSAEYKNRGELEGMGIPITLVKFMLDKYSFDSKTGTKTLDGGQIINYTSYNKVEFMNKLRKVIKKISKATETLYVHHKIGKRFKFAKIEDFR